MHMQMRQDDNLTASCVLLVMGLPSVVFVMYRMQHRVRPAPVSRLRSKTGPTQFNHLSVPST